MRVFSLNHENFQLSLELDEYTEGDKKVFTCRFKYSSINKEIFIYKLDFNKELLSEFSFNLKDILNGYIKECCLRDHTKQIKFMICEVAENFSLSIRNDPEKPQSTIYLKQKVDYYPLKSLHKELVEFISVF
ncbi:hypothetical protein [Bacillus sp. NPDC077027]|uniref:hypothetical protein n=1 Tax=Bacillus sp. NPDC077027 TaxID=3390548 RepID=UPI003D0000F9